MRESQAIPRSPAGATSPVPEVIEVGAQVYVCDRYLGNWCHGFVVAEVLDDGYRLRRLSDGREFPDVFSFDDVHPERRRPGTSGVDGSHLDRRRQFP